VLSVSPFCNDLKTLRDIFDFHCIDYDIQIVFWKSIEHELMIYPFCNLLLLIKIFKKYWGLVSYLFIELSKRLSGNRHFLFSIV